MTRETVGIKACVSYDTRSHSAGGRVDHSYMKRECALFSTHSKPAEPHLEVEITNITALPEILVDMALAMEDYDPEDLMGLPIKTVAEQCRDLAEAFETAAARLRASVRLEGA